MERENNVKEKNHAYISQYKLRLKSVIIQGMPFLITHTTLNSKASV